MLNTNICRCKTLLQRSLGALNADLCHKIDLRCYSLKVIYSSESPHEPDTKREHFSRQEQPLNSQNISSNKLPKKNYGHRNRSYKLRNDQRINTEKNTYFNKQIDTPIQIFDTKYTFLDKTERKVIKPRIPVQKDVLKADQPIKRNYKITDNPSYQNHLSYEQDKEENETIQIENDHNDRDRSSRKLRKRYIFDSNLEFKQDIDDNAPLQLDMNESNESTNTECTVDTSNINCSTDSSLTPRLKTLDTPEGKVTLNLADDEFDMSDFMKEFNEKIPGPLEQCTEDISHFGPDFLPTFNFAAYADKSKLIQQYVKLGVKLYKVEKNMDHMRALLTVDLEKELPLYIQFLHDCGIPANCLGDAITENPMILKEDLDDMRTRIRYLAAHNFAPDSIARIVTKNPSWLVWATKYIDERLGHFQNEFKLGGSEMRFLATKAPKLITYPLRHVNENTFAVREQMGFSQLETKLLLLYKPRLWMNSRKKILDSFDYLHNTMQLSHRTIASQADVMTTRKSRIQSRHEFLVELKKAQYDPKKPGYIAPKTLVVGSDADFCTKVAKAAVDTYNLFLRTR